MTSLRDGEKKNDGTAELSPSSALHKDDGFLVERPDPARLMPNKPDDEWQTTMERLLLPAFRQHQFFFASPLFFFTWPFT